MDTTMIDRRFSEWSTTPDVRYRKWRTPAPFTAYCLFEPWEAVRARAGTIARGYVCSAYSEHNSSPMASRTPLDALAWRNGPMLAMVSCEGAIAEGDGLFWSERQTVIQVADASKTLDSFVLPATMEAVMEATVLRLSAVYGTTHELYGHRTRMADCRCHHPHLHWGRLYDTVYRMASGVGGRDVDRFEIAWASGWTVLDNAFTAHCAGLFA